MHERATFHGVALFRDGVFGFTVGCSSFTADGVLEEKSHFRSVRDVNNYRAL
jgi:hypothetical protein